VIGYLAVIGSAFLVSFASMPLLRALSFRVGAVVHPDARRVHKQPTAILGGAGIVAGVLVGFGVGWLTGEFRPVFRTIAPPLGVVLATLTMYAVGQLDDLREVSAPAKTAGSVLAGSVLAISGVAILFFRVPFLGLVSLPPDLIPLITVLWVVGMAQAVNLIDGLDGLAAGVVAIAAGAILLFAEHLDNDDSIISDDNIGALIAACVVGACLGYLPWNFNPAKIFIGTTGVMVLGYLLAVLAILGSAKIPVALLILGVPIIDTFWIITRRLLSGHSPFTPDRGHFHHRLLDLGLSHRGAVLLIYVITTLLAVLSLVLAGGSGPLYAFMAIVIGSGVLLLLVTFRVGPDEALEASSYPDERSGMEAVDREAGGRAGEAAVPSPDTPSSGTPDDP
jgi:UDP-GlcNAc:undecaprenyl-phosphate/decaprenyl-phosphate GlcNAc-1-phosphate transferase